MFVSPTSNPDFAELAFFSDVDKLLEPDGEVTKAGGTNNGTRSL